MISLRQGLGAVLASHVSYAELRAKGKGEATQFETLYHVDYKESFRTIRDSLNSLSYDIPLRVVGHELHRLCSDIIVKGPDTTVAEFGRLQRLKKMAFRLIYEEGGGNGLAYVSLAEVENLLGKAQCRSSGFGEFQEMLKDEEAARELRRQIEAGDTNSRQALN